MYVRRDQQGKGVGKAILAYLVGLATDYGFHAMICDLTDAVLDEIVTLPARGVTSIKLFMAYRGALMVDDRTILRTLAAAKQHGILVMVHAENGDAADMLQQQYMASGNTEPKFHAPSRPPRVEAEATARASALAELAGAPIYFVHVSCGEAVDEILRARARGVKVMGETCTHYLYFNEEDLDRPNFEGAKWVYTPPPRGKHMPALMWQALVNGSLGVVASCKVVGPEVLIVGVVGEQVPGDHQHGVGHSEDGFALSLLAEAPEESAELGR